MRVLRDFLQRGAVCLHDHRHRVIGYPPCHLPCAGAGRPASGRPPAAGGPRWTGPEGRWVLAMLHVGQLGTYCGGVLVLPYNVQLCEQHNSTLIMDH